jgi:hypothetical protein
MGELDHVRKREVTALKAFITERSPRFRAAYGRRTTEHPRRCVFAGTTNDETYLADATGNRRFWPLRCGVIDLAALARDRDQLWAEAVHRVRAGEPWHITDEGVRAEAEAAQGERRIVDPWQEAIERHVQGRERVTSGEILEHLGLKTEFHHPGHSMRVAAVMRGLGWVRRSLRLGTLRRWVYEPRHQLLDPHAPMLVTGQVIDFPYKSHMDPMDPMNPNRERNKGDKGEEGEGAHANSRTRDFRDPPQTNGSFGSGVEAVGNTQKNEDPTGIHPPDPAGSVGSIRDDEGGEWS